MEKSAELTNVRTTWTDSDMSHIEELKVVFDTKMTSSHVLTLDKYTNLKKLHIVNFNGHLMFDRFPKSLEVFIGENITPKTITIFSDHHESSGLKSVSLKFESSNAFVDDLRRYCREKLKNYKIDLTIG